MAAGPFVFPDLAKLNMFNATGLLGASTSNFKMALIKSTWTPNNASDEVFATPQAQEIAAGNGYTSGGIAMSGVSLSQTSGTVKFAASPVIWTAAGGAIPAWRRGVVYYSGTLNGKANPIVGHFLGDSTPADIAATTDGNTLTVTPAAGGILNAA